MPIINTAIEFIIALFSFLIVVIIIKLFTPKSAYCPDCKHYPDNLTHKIGETCKKPMKTPTGEDKSMFIQNALGDCPLFEKKGRRRVK